MMLVFTMGAPATAVQEVARIVRAGKLTGLAGHQWELNVARQLLDDLGLDVVPGPGQLIIRPEGWVQNETD